MWLGIERFVGNQIRLLGMSPWKLGSASQVIVAGGGMCPNQTVCRGTNFLYSSGAYESGVRLGREIAYRSKSKSKSERVRNHWD